MADMERSMTAAGITIKAAPLSRRFLQPEKCGAYGTHAIRSKTPMHPQISAAMPEITNNANIKSSFLGAAFLNIITVSYTHLTLPTILLV